MKIRNLIAISLMLISHVTFAQERVSPPAEVVATISGAKIKINYSQPSVKDRKVWDGLVPYGKVWRTGANEATTFETSKDITVQGKTLKAGKYALFTIPNEGEWTIIFNSIAGQWGAYDYSADKDALRVTASSSSSDFVEKFTISETDGNITLAWEKVKVDFTIK